MAKIRLRHTHAGGPHESYDYRIESPTVRVQKCGDRWMLRITHTDSTTHLAAYFLHLETARLVAEMLIQRYASAPHGDVQFYVRCALDLIANDVPHLVSGAPRPAPLTCEACATTPQGDSL